MARSTTSYKLGILLERMMSVDKDLRYMAASDLMQDIERQEIQMDDDGEKKVSRSLLKMLEDKSTEVQQICIKCIGSLTNRISSKDSLSLILTSLSDMINTKSGEIYCTALKTVVNQLSPAKGGENATNAIKELYPKLLSLLETTDDSMASELLDICSELLLRYGTKLPNHHDRTLQVICQWVTNGRSMSRKRATVTLGSLTACCNNEIFKKTVENIFKWLNSKPSDQLKLRNYVMASNYVCKSRGNQFSLYLSEILPKLKAICNDTEDEDTRESVLTTLEVFVYFCAGNIADYQEDIQATLLRYLSHDPNYCLGDGDEEMDVEDADWEEDDENQYSDTDDDLSWKVRRACAKALAAEVKYLDNTGKKLLNWEVAVAPKLIDRMKDREDHVLIEVIHALKEMTLQVNKFLPEQGMQSVDSFGDASGQTEATYEQTAVREQLEKLHPRIITGLTRIIEKKTTITRASCFELLIELTKTIPNKLTGDFVLSAVKCGLEDKTGGSQIKMLVLQFFAAVLKTHDSSTFLQQVPQLTKILIGAVDDNFYKIVSEAVNVLSRFADVLLVLKKSNTIAAATHIDNVYGLFQNMLQKNHGDLEVVHRIINATGNYLGKLADQTNPKEETLLILLTEISERTSVDQNTTVASLVALKAVAENAKTKTLFANKLEGIIGNLANLIEKNSGAATSRSRDSVVDLQNHILDLSVTIFNTQDVTPDSANIRRLAIALPTLLNDSDLQIAHKALQCMLGSLQMGLHDPSFMPALTQLFESHLLGGATLQLAIQTTTALSKELMSQGTKYEQILDELTSPVYDKPNLPRQAYKAIAMATAEIAAAVGDRERALKLANQLVGHLQSANNNERLFSIVALGELGRTFPAVYDGATLKPQHLLATIFSSQADELRTVAAQSLGALAAGNPDRYVPFIIEELNNSSGNAQLPLLHSIRETLTTRKLPSEHVSNIWPVLVAHANAQEESVCTVVADCIAKLCDEEPEEGLVALEKLLKDGSGNIRYTAVSAFKVIVFDGSNIQNKMLAPYLKGIGKSISDEDIRVRRIGLIVLNALFFKRTQLMRAYVREILPAVYFESKIKKELIREVEMGPFKHQVDDGIEVRKAAYECLFTILERCPNEMNLEEFLHNLEDGLKDSNHDIKLLTCLIISRVTVLAPAAIVATIHKLTDQLKVLLQMKVKSNAVRQEVERNEEMKKAVLRLIKNMQKVDGVDNQMADVSSTIAFNTELKVIMEQVEKETAL